MQKGFAPSLVLAAGILACADSLAQDRPWGIGVPAAASECGQLAANSALREIRYHANRQAPASTGTPQQLAEFAQVLAKDPRFVGSLRCLQTLSSPQTSR